MTPDERRAARSAALQDDTLTTTTLDCSLDFAAPSEADLINRLVDCLTLASDHEVAITNVIVGEAAPTAADLDQVDIHLRQARLLLDHARRYVRRIRLERTP